MPKLKVSKAESGANEVTLSWKASKNSVSYYVYQNGNIVDSTTTLTASIETEAGTENCYTIAGVDKYGSVGQNQMQNVIKVNLALLIQLMLLMIEEIII